MISTCVDDSCHVSNFLYRSLFEELSIFASMHHGDGPKSFLWGSWLRFSSIKRWNFAHKSRGSFEFDNEYCNRKCGENFNYVAWCVLAVLAILTYIVHSFLNESDKKRRHRKWWVGVASFSWNFWIQHAIQVSLTLMTTHAFLTIQKLINGQKNMLHVLACRVIMDIHIKLWTQRI